MIRDLKCLPYEERLRDRGLFITRKTEGGVSSLLMNIWSAGTKLMGARWLCCGVQQQNKVLQSKTGTQEVAYKHEEELCYCQSNGAPEEDVQRGCGASFFGDTQNSPGHFPVWPTPGSLLYRELGHVVSRAPFQPLCDPMAALVCKHLWNSTTLTAPPYIQQRGYQLNGRQVWATRCIWPERPSAPLVALIWRASCN